MFVIIVIEMILAANTLITSVLAIETMTNYFITMIRFKFTVLIIYYDVNKFLN